jgi:acyl transferase domain-containing protein
MSESERVEELCESGVAIVGMAGRFPRAYNVEEFWRNLCAGVEAVSFFTDEELTESGISPASFNRPDYVRARAVIDDAEMFDASFFGINPREAEIIDPQQRLFLEHAWDALESAGYDPETYRGAIGLYAGAGLNSYVLNVFSAPEVLNAVGGFQARMANDGSHLPTRVSYKLNLRGPSVNVQTSCSTSLVAVHLACQSLLNGECDMALAGGVSVAFPQKEGYYYQEGAIASPDGHCRPFDAAAQGPVRGNGVGVVVLKRYADALRDRDHVTAIIRGSAINNDGSAKIGYMAPSVRGQAAVITEAQALAGVSPETISYIEAHGTATPLGDPIEVEALTLAFRGGTSRRNFCALGSVKSAIGHLDAAAGITGLIKTALALRHRRIPASLHFTEPNPKLKLEESPFYVNASLAEWRAGETPRRAAVSSFGIGGTNAHVILEETPPLGDDTGRDAGEARGHQLLLLSARTGPALERATANLAEHFRRHPDLDLADAAYTLQVGRRAFAHRRAVVCRRDLGDAADALERRDPARVFTSPAELRGRPVAFMFSGQGSQYVGMGRGLYEAEPVFRRELDACAALLEPRLGRDLRALLYPPAGDEEESERLLTQTSLTQPALFAVEYALARLWMEWGLKPSAMIGHSLGEYVAACLAGVFTLEDALAVVAARGRLMQQCDAGTMLAVPLAAEELRPLLGASLSLAAVNGPMSCVVSGPTDAVAEFAARLAARGIEGRPLHTSHAFHSHLMEPILGEFAALLGRMRLSPPSLPFVSNVTGTWITEREATSPDYWARHLRQTVLFADGLGELLRGGDAALLEVGPGQTLCTLARRQRVREDARPILGSLRHPHEEQSDVAFILNTAGRLWLSGVKLDWAQFNAGRPGRRIPLPTYPFERQRFWIELRRVAALAPASSIAKRADVAEWFYLPAWKQSARPAREGDGDAPWLVFADECGIGGELAEQLRRAGRRVTVVSKGDSFIRIGEEAYALGPADGGGYASLFGELQARDALPSRVVHLWGVTPEGRAPKSAADARESAEEASAAEGFDSLIHLARALGESQAGESVKLLVVTNNAQEVTGAERLRPSKSLALGACKVIPQEYANVECRCVDISTAALGGARLRQLAANLMAEASSTQGEPTIAYRGRKRWALTFEPRRLDEPAPGERLLREGGVYLITGGLGHIGTLLAAHLARTVGAKLCLVGRTQAPPREEWDDWLTRVDGGETARRVRALKEIEEVGGEVLTVAADVTDERQMREAVELTRRQFGRLDGVFHAAGGQSLRPIQDTDAAAREAHFGPKVRGLLVLEKVLRGSRLDFCLLMSSLSSALGGLGNAVGAASDSFLDAFAHAQSRRSTYPWISVNWDGWRFTEEKGSAPAVGATQAEFNITPVEGMAVFERVLWSDAPPQLVVSTGDLHARLRQWVGREPKREAKAEAPASLYERPELSNDFVEPGDEVEQVIAEIWQNLLGIARVGAGDNFFDLGGDSLLATQAVARLRAAFQVSLPLRVFFERPTVRGQSLAIEEALTDEIENLTEEETEQLLEGQP